MKIFQWLKPQPVVPVYGLTKALARNLRETPPGVATILKGIDGEEYAIMPLDDYEHILRRAGMKFVEQSNV